MNNIKIEYMVRNDHPNERPQAWDDVEPVLGSIEEVVANLIAQRHTNLQDYVPGEIYMKGYHAGAATQQLIDIELVKPNPYRITLRRRWDTPYPWKPFDPRPSSQVEIVTYLRRQYLDMTFLDGAQTNVWMDRFECPPELRAKCFEVVGLQDLRFV